MSNCRHCQQPLPEHAGVCPHCGMTTQASTSAPGGPSEPPPFGETDARHAFTTGAAAPPLDETPAEPIAPTQEAQAPRDARGWSDLAVQQVEAGDALGAFRSFHESLALAPEEAETWFRVGNAYVSLSAYHHALAAFERARQLDPGHERARFWLERTRSHALRPDPPVPDLGLAAAGGAPQPPRPAAAARRLAAFGCDLVVIFFCLCVVQLFAQIVVGATRGGSLFLSDSEPHPAFSWVFFYFVTLYFSLSHALVQQTPGMMLLAIRIENRKRAAPGLLQSLARTLLFFPLSCLAPLFLPFLPGRSLHDLAVGTHVVETR